MDSEERIYTSQHLHQLVLSAFAHGGQMVPMLLHCQFSGSKLLLLALLSLLDRLAERLLELMAPSGILLCLFAHQGCCCNAGLPRSLPKILLSSSKWTSGRDSISGSGSSAQQTRTVMIP